MIDANVLSLMDGWGKSEAVPLVLWFHARYGVYACGLFRMHDEVGFSLSDSLIECKKRKYRPCLAQFRADAIRAGWGDSQIELTISNAVLAANTMNF